MLNRIISFSLHNRPVVLICAVLLTVAGIYSTLHTDVDIFPDLNAPTVVVMTEAGGMAPEEVERLVTFPVETAVNGAMGVRRVRSSSSSGFSVVWVEFDWGTDIYRARQIVSEKLAVAAENLPENVGRPTLGPQSSILGEVMIIGLTAGHQPDGTESGGGSTTAMDLRTIADWTIRPRLLSVGGVAQVAVIGGDPKEFRIQLDPARMKHYRVSLDEVLAACRNMNRNVGGGVLYEYKNEYLIRGMLSTTRVEDLEKGIVKRADGTSVMLGSIASVKAEAKTPRLGAASEKGIPAVLLTVTKQPETSTIALTEQLDRVMADLQKTLPPDVRVSTDIFRQSRFIDSAIANIQKSLFEGSIFVVLVLFLFLMNIRTTFISLVALPLSLLTSVGVLFLSGLTINTMSLGGMAIAIGSLVDDAIVDVENVYKRIGENRLLPPGQQRGIKEVVYEASREVRMPILNSTLIIIVSFLPLFFLSGMEGRMLIPLGIAFIVALLASTVVALTLTPVLCSLLLKEPTGKGKQESWIVRLLKHFYEKALRKVLLRKKIVLTATATLFVIAICVFFTLGRNFLPAFNEGSFTVNVSSLPGISIEESDKIGRRAELLLLEIPEIQTVARKTGRAELDEHALGIHVSEIEAPFVLGKRSRRALMEEVRRKLSEISGANIEVGQPISHRIDAMLSGTQANIAIKLFGSDLNRMFALGNQIKEAIKETPGLVDLNVEQQIERPQLAIVPRREILAQRQISLPEFDEYIRVLLGGEVVGQVYEEGKAFDLTVRASDNRLATMEDIGNLMIDAGNEKIPLSEVAEIRSTAGPNTINRENVQRRIVISGNVSGRDLGSVVHDIRQKVAKTVSLPEGYHIAYGGQFESEQAASRMLLFTSLISLLVIFLLLYNECKDLKESAVVLLNLPLALIGGIFILRFTSGEISIPAIIGFISLFGIATRNGMLLTSHYNQLRKEGFSLSEAIVKGSLDRLNPILMTALSSALALIPLAVNGDLSGNEIQSPMAIVILGGLLTSTFLNGFIIPIVYFLLKNDRVRQSNK